MTRLTQILFFSLLLCASSALAMQEQLPQPASLPIEVSAQQLDASQEKGQAVFSGEVVARQGDITLYCDKLIVHSQSGAEQLDHLEALGNVRFVQRDRTATADRAIYRQLQGTLILYGHAAVHQGQNSVTGNEITVYLQENRSVVKGGESERVKAVLFPDQKQGQE
jgi:lipopolysaccharide export system protein LptA